LAETVRVYAAVGRRASARTSITSMTFGYNIVKVLAEELNIKQVLLLKPRINQCF